MARLLAYVANRADRLMEALQEERDAVGAAPPAQADAWGIGFYQSGEVLHKKRPHRGGDVVSWDDIAGNVRSDTAIIHLRAATVGDYRAENTHPFRMRHWLFAHHGTVLGFESIRDGLVEALPDFLRRNVRGGTDSEHVFHVFLSFLHDAAQLDNPDIEPKVVLSALRSTISMIDRLTSEVGAPNAQLNLAISNGRLTLFARRGAPAFYRERSIVDRHAPAAPFRYVLAWSGEGGTEGANEIPSDQVLVIDRAPSATLVAL